MMISGEKYTENQLYEVLSKLISELKFELEFIYSSNYINNLFDTAYETLSARLRVRKKLEILGPEKLGFPSLSEIPHDYIVATAGKTFEEFKDSISISYFASNEMGPELIYHLNDSLISEEQAFKSAIFYFTLTTSQNEKSMDGLFGPLPVSTSSEETNLSAMIYILNYSEENEMAEMMGLANSGLIIVFYNPKSERIASDSNKISFIIKSRIGGIVDNSNTIDKSTIAEIREDIAQFLSD